MTVAAFLQESVIRRNILLSVCLAPGPLPDTLSPGETMPVLTFLHDALAYAKGPHYRYLGRHTKTFCSRAARQAKTPVQRRVWFSTAISADEVIGSLARLETRRPMGSLANWQVQPKADRRRYLKALHVYLVGPATALRDLQGGVACKAGNDGRGIHEGLAGHLPV